MIHFFLCVWGQAEINIVVFINQSLILWQSLSLSLGFIGMWNELQGCSCISLCNAGNTDTHATGSHFVSRSSRDQKSGLHAYTVITYACYAGDTAQTQVHRLEWQAWNQVSHLSRCLHFSFYTLTFSATLRTYWNTIPQFIDIYQPLFKGTPLIINQNLSATLPNLMICWSSC